MLFSAKLFSGTKNNYSLTESHATGANSHVLPSNSTAHALLQITCFHEHSKPEEETKPAIVASLFYFLMRKASKARDPVSQTKFAGKKLKN